MSTLRTPPRLVWITPDAEKVIGYCARVSNPANQDNPDASRLLKYCVKHQHWSIFEMANACFEIETSRAITAQILRHRSFTFQEFSQRYAESYGIEYFEGRRQDEKNRQNSTSDLDPEDAGWWLDAQTAHHKACSNLYQDALARGIAKEQARAVLPMATTSRIYMNGSIRSWMHYINLRAANGTQKEHQDIALAIREILIKELPVVSAALEWTSNG